MRISVASVQPEQRNMPGLLRSGALLFESDATHTYLAETGLIGGPFPNHKTIFTADHGFAVR